jgi:hypothetical protein
MNQYYMLAVHSVDDEPPKPMTDEEMRQGHALVAGLEAEMKAAGAFVFSGRLDHPDRARVVRTSRGRVRSTDGPFAETRSTWAGSISSPRRMPMPHSNGPPR